MTYIQPRGIVHRELKPESLLIEANQQETGKIKIKIADFALGLLISTQAKVKDLPFYFSAPESSTGNYSEKTDNWSLGVLLHLMLCGRPPFLINQIPSEEELKKSDYKGMFVISLISIKIVEYSEVYQINQKI